MNRKQIRAAALLVALLSLTGCGKGGGEQEDAAALPTEYSFEGETIVALATEEEGVQFAQAKTVTYHYDGLSASGRTAASYTSDLVSAGFTVVDEELVKTDRPDFDAGEGMVRLAKDAAAESEESEGEADSEENEEPAEPEDPKVTLIVLNWSEGACSVTIDEMEGMVTFPPPEETVGAVSMTLSEAVDYIRNLPPAALGLDGDSMGNYQIYAQEGSVLVGGYACLRLNVYSTDNPAHTNQFVGSFLMTSDGRHLYRSDVVAGTVEELEMP